MVDRTSFYPPKGAAIADPGWGPIDFSYVLIILSCFLETYLSVSNAPYYPPFENSENALL